MDKFIELIKYIIIGIIQGISEILPISSSAHLAIAYFFLNIDVQSQFNITIFLHFASSLALCIYFKDIIIKMVKGFFGYILKKEIKYKEGFLLAIYLILASIPSIIVGLFIKPMVENSFNNIILICINLIITAILLLTFPLFKKNKIETYSFKNTFIKGLFQCFAMFPGISRSGITLLGSKVAKLNEQKGKEFSFLLLIPISLGSFILSLIDVSSLSFNIEAFLIYFISMIITFIFTLLALKFFLKKSNKISTIYYAIYLLLLSLITIFLYNNYF